MSVSFKLQYYFYIIELNDHQLYELYRFKNTFELVILHILNSWFSYYRTACYISE